MKPEHVTRAIASLDERRLLLDYANDPHGESWPRPEIHAAVVEVLDALARAPRAVWAEDARERSEGWIPGEMPTANARRIKALLDPVLRKAWGEVSPYILGQDWTLEGKGSIVGLPADLDLKSTDEPEGLLVLSLWFLLRLLGSGVVTLQVKRCEECGKFYFDASRGQRGRFCGGACRVRNFRRE